MKLPDNRIGITDVLAFRDCPRRFAFGMERHGPEGEHPESGSPATAYGSAFHDVVEALCSGTSEEDAVTLAFRRYGHSLEPEHLKRLRRDLATYQQRLPEGVRLIANETEVEIPLFEHDGDMIYFRGRIDRVWEYEDQPGRYLHEDYKTSMHRKGEEEVHRDLQLWAYNWAVFEWWPECQHLEQSLNQLNFDRVSTSKSAQEREVFRAWFIAQVKAILSYDETGEDGRPEPRRNEWCGSCEIVESCPIIGRLTNFALAEIAALAPQEKQGRSYVVDLAGSAPEDYVARLAEVQQARGILERFEKAVKDKILSPMADNELAAVGYRMQRRRSTVRQAGDLRSAHQMMGDDAFYAAITLSDTRLKGVGLDDALVEEIRELGEKVPTSSYVVPVKST